MPSRLWHREWGDQRAVATWHKLASLEKGSAYIAFPGIAVVEVSL